MSGYGYQRKSGPCRYDGEFTPDTGHQVTNVGNRPADFRVAPRSGRGRWPWLTGSYDPEPKLQPNQSGSPALRSPP